MNVMSIRPMHNNILVKPDPKVEEVTKGGVIALAESHVRETITGEVLAIGPGRYNGIMDKTIPVNVRCGDRIIFSHLDRLVVYDDENNPFYLMADSDVRAIFETKEVEVDGE